MKHTTKRALSLILSLAMIFALAVSSGVSASAANKVSITIFNSKNEIQEHLEEAAEEYGKANGVEIEVYYSQDTVSAHLATRYAAKDPYTMAWGRLCSCASSSCPSYTACI